MIGELTVRQQGRDKLFQKLECHLTKSQISGLEIPNFTIFFFGQGQVATAYLNIVKKTTKTLRIVEVVSPQLYQSVQQLILIVVMLFL